MQNKYSLLFADTLEALHRHRIHIEDVLRRPNLSPEHRLALESELIAVKLQEAKSQKEIDKEEVKEDQEGEGEGSGRGSSGGGGGGYARSGKGDSSGEGEGDDGGMGQMSAMLFFSADHDFVDLQREEGTDGVDNTSFEIAADAMLMNSVAAAIMLFEAEEANVPYLPESKVANNRDVLLPMIEQHALSRGARTLNLNVKASAVAAYLKHGYKVGSAKKNMKLVQLRKKLFVPQSQPD